MNCSFEVYTSVGTQGCMYRGNSINSHGLYEDIQGHIYMSSKILVIVPLEVSHTTLYHLEFQLR